jgi:PNMA
MDPNVKAMLEAMALQHKQQQELLQQEREKRKAQQEADRALIQQLLNREPRVNAQGEQINGQPQPAIGQAAPVVASLHNELSERMKDFDFDPEENKTFDKWYARYQTIFTMSAATMSDSEKVSLLTEKLSTSDYNKYAMTILPATDANISFADAVKALNNIFGRKESLFSLRYQCLKVSMEESESFEDYTARVNLKCEKYDAASLSAEDFKVLIFVKSLQATKHSSVLQKLLTKLDQQEILQAAAAEGVVISKLTLQEACNIATRLKLLKGETDMVTTEASSPAEVLMMQKKGNFHKKQYYNPRDTNNDQQTTNSQGSPPSPCFMCSDDHWVAECPFTDNKCYTCGKTGHKAGHCSSAEAYERHQEQKHNATSSATYGIKAGNLSTRKFVQPIIAGKQLRLLLDSGSD